LAAGVKYLTQNSLIIIDKTEKALCVQYYNNSLSNISINRIEINNQSFSLDYLEQICKNQ